MTTSSDQQSESDTWLGLAAERGVKLVFLQDVDLTDKAHKGALYQQFDIPNDMFQQAELLTFVRTYQQQQQPNHSEDIKQKIEHIETMMIESKTDERDMSKANTDFATDLLTGLSISWYATNANLSVGVGSAVGNFKWDQTYLKEGKAMISENDGTPAALEWLFGKLE